MPIFLNLPGIEGESTDARHKGEIPVDSAQFGSGGVVTSPGGTSTGRESGGGSVPGEVLLTKMLDNAAADLALAAGKSTHFPTAVLTFRGQGDKEVIYFLTDVIISSYSASSGGPDGPTATFSLSYGSVSMLSQAEVDALRKLGRAYQKVKSFFQARK